MYVKLIAASVVIALVGWLYLYQAHLKTTIAEQGQQIVQYEADLDKLQKELEFMKVDKLSLENGVAALQESLKMTKSECDNQARAIDAKYKILLNRQYKEIDKLAKAGAIDEKTSDSFIQHFNSRFFAN